MKRFLVLIVVLCASMLSLFADTAYEKKTQEIMMKYYTIFKYGYQRPATSEDYIEVAYGGYELTMLTYQLQYPDQCAKLLQQMEKELKKAELLMTEEDRLKEWKKSDYGKMVTYFQDSFSKIIVKSQFETKAQYYNRIEKQAKEKFMLLCCDLYEDIMQSLQIIISPVSYDAETQIYTLKVKETFKYAETEIEKEFNTSVKMSPRKAPKIVQTTLTGQSIKNIKLGVVRNKDVFISEAELLLDANNKIQIKIPNLIQSETLKFSIQQIESEMPWKLTWYSDVHSKSFQVFESLNKQLADSVHQYNLKLSENPYHYSSAKLQTDKFKLKKSSMGSSNIRNLYEDNLITLRNDYQKLDSTMEDNCKLNNPEKHAAVYYKLHPDFAERVDSIHHYYRCEYTLNQIAVKLLNNQTIAQTTCLETQYNSYKYLFTSHQDFIELYNNTTAKEFEQEVAKRFDNVLKSNKYSCLRFKDAKISGYTEALSVISLYEDLKAVSNITAENLITKNEQMSNDYDKSINYWESPDEFLNAYISGNYKTILHAKKKQSRNAKQQVRKAKLNYLWIALAVPVAVGGYYIYGAAKNK